MTRLTLYVWITGAILSQTNISAYTVSPPNDSTYASLSVHYREKRQIFPQSMSTNFDSLAAPIDEGRIKDLVCRVGRANPPPNIFWRLGQNDIAETKREITGNNEMVSTLILTIKRDHNGQMVECVPKYPGFSLDDFQRTARITVIFKPTDVNPNFPSRGGFKATEGEVTTLSCSISSANPAPEVVRWTFDNAEVRESRQTTTPSHYNAGSVTSFLDRSYDRTDHKKTVACVPVWRGERVDSLMRNTILNVQFEPLDVANDFQLKVTEGVRHTFSCNSTPSNPKTRYAWRFSGPDVYPEQHVKDLGVYGFVTYTFFTFTPTRTDNDRQIMCLAYNWDDRTFFSKASMKLNLKVKITTLTQTARIKTTEAQDTNTTGTTLRSGHLEFLPSTSRRNACDSFLTILSVLYVSIVEYTT